MKNIVSNISLYRVAFWLFAILPALLLASRAAADIAMSLTAIFFLVNSYRYKDWGWVRRPMSKSIFIFWIVLLLVSLFAVHSVENSFGRALAWIRHPLFFLAIAYWIFDVRENKADDKKGTMVKYGKKLYIIVGVILAYTVVNMLVQYITGVSIEGRKIAENGTRLTASLDRPNIGIYLTKLSFPVIGFAIWLYAKNNNIKGVAAGIASIFVVAAMVLITGERTASIMCLAAIAMIMIFGCIFLPKYRCYLLALGVLFAASIAVVIITQPTIMMRVNDLITHLASFRETPYGQLFIVSIEMIKDNPLTGVGLKNFRDVCPVYLAANIVNHCNLHPHNAYLEVGAAAGLGGIIALIYIVYQITRYIVARIMVRESSSTADKMLGAFAIAPVFVSFFPVQASQSFFSNWAAILLWLSLSIAIAGVNTANYARPQGNSKNNQ